VFQDGVALLAPVDHDCVDGRRLLLLDWWWLLRLRLLLLRV
jgi:hypothetical protein